MKRIISLLISFSMLMCFISIPGIAAVELSTAVTPAYDANGDLFYNVSVWANFGAENKGNSVVIEMVKKSTGFSGSLTDGDIYYIDETVIGASGIAKFDFKLKTFDEFTVRFSSKDFVISSSSKKDITLLSETEASDLIDGILSSQDISGDIEDNAYVLNVNLEFYNDLTNKAPVEAALKNNKDKINITNFNSYFDEAVIFSYLKTITDADKIIKMLEYYEDSYLKLDQVNPANIYETYLAMDDATKAKLIASLKTASNSSFSALRNNFNELVILTALKNYDKTQLDKVFTDNSDLVSLSGYSSLTYADKSNILGKLMSDKSIKSVSDIELKYITYYNQTLNPGILPPASGGGGGGGGGSSTNVTVDKELVTPEVQDKVDLNTDFIDLDTHEWAKEAIETLAKQEILSGKGNRQFCPGDNITREEFTKIMVLAFDLYSDKFTCDFTDVTENDWFYTYVASGKEAGLIVGRDDGSYGVGQPITRQDMAVMVHRLLAKLIKMDRVTDMSKEYDDMAEVSGYAANSVKILLNAGIMQGDNNKFHPTNNATRAEAAQLIFNIIGKVNE